MAEKLVVATLEPVAVGEQFDSLPLHVTLMPWFEISQNNVPLLSRYLGIIASKRTSLQLIGEDFNYFGPKNDVPVRVLKDTKQLRKIHGDIVASVGWSDGRCYSDYIRGSYAPHVSYVGEESINRGEIIEVNAVQLIDRDYNTKVRTVDQVFGLGDVPAEEPLLLGGHDQ